MLSNYSLGRTQKGRDTPSTGSGQASRPTGTGFMLCEKIFCFIRKGGIPSRPTGSGFSLCEKIFGFILISDLPGLRDFGGRMEDSLSGRACLKSKLIPLIHANLREFRNASRGLADTPSGSFDCALSKSAFRPPEGTPPSGRCERREERSLRRTQSKDASLTPSPSGVLREDTSPSACYAILATTCFLFM